MFCPKCGGQNPEEGKFCRSCGTSLVSGLSALATESSVHPLVDKKGKPVNWEGAITKFATGIAFLAIAIVLAVTNMAGGKVWWFWMLIPAFTMIGSGVAQYIQLKKLEKGPTTYIPTEAVNNFSPTSNVALPSPQTEWVAPESRYKTGDLVPPSVIENTTRHLQMDSETKTMALPKK